MEKKKKTLCFILVICLVMTMFSFAPGVFAAENENPQATIVDRTGAAVPGGENLSLDLAIRQAADGQIVKLLTDVSVEETILINKFTLQSTPVPFEIDLNGHMISSEKTSPTIKIQAGDLTIRNGKIRNTVDAAIVVNNGAKVSFGEGVTIASRGAAVTGDGDKGDADSYTQKEIFSILYSGSGKGGTISGTSFVEKGDQASYAIKLNSGYKITAIAINDKAVLKNTLYTGTSAVFTPQTDSVVVKVTFKALSKYKITTSSNNAYGGSVTASAAVKENSSKSIKIKTNKGYKLSDVKIDGKSKGAITSYTFKNIKKSHKVAVTFKKTSFFIMLDAGHYGLYNRSPIYNSYYESNMSWTLHTYLKAELDKYKNVIVGTTRSEQKKDKGVYDRGYASGGYDLFLSLHSNSSGSRSADYPLVIVQKGNTKSKLANNLGKTMRNTMGTEQNYQIWQRLNRDGKTEYYGVLRGAKAVGTQGMILEHSFHTNRAATKWLMSKSNLKTMAKAEAKVIADYYGLSKTGSDTITPSKPRASSAYYNYNTVRVKWTKSLGASGYEIYRAAAKSGDYKRIKTVTGGSTLSYKNTGLTTGKTYYYKIRPYRTSGGKKCYGSFSGIAYRTPKPQTPSVKSTAGKRKITVSWKRVSGASGYKLYRKSGSGGAYKGLSHITKGSTTKHTNKGLKKDRRYSYKMRAYRTVNGKRIYSDFSSSTSKIVQ